MATSEIALTRLKIKAIADTVTGLSAARNKLGTHDIPAGTDFFGTMASSGPFLMVYPGRLTERDQTTGSTKFEIDARLWFGFPGDADYDWTAIEDILYTESTGLISSFGVTSNWRPGDATNGCIPQRIDFAGEPEIRSDLKPIVACYKWTFHFIGCLG